MTIIKNTFAVSAEKEFDGIHITDIHLTLCDERESETLTQLSEIRQNIYTHGFEVLHKASELSKELNAVIFNTGDMTDFVSCKNLEYIKTYNDQNDCMFIAGNHDFRPGGGMKYDVPAVQAKMLDRVQRVYKNDIRFSSRIINGVNFVGIDNAYYRFCEEHFEKLKKEVKKGLPIVLLLHVPLYAEDLFHFIVQGNTKYASLVSVPAEMMTEYPPERFKQQIDDEITREMTEYIKNTDAIKLLIAGHLHKPFETVLNNRLPMIMTPINAIRQIHFT